MMMNGGGKEHGASSGAGQPTGAQSTGSGQGKKPFIPLAMLNGGSAALGTWHVQICHPRVHSWTYMKQGQRKEGRAFRCHLVMPEDPSMYCLAEVARFDPLTPPKLKSLAEMEAKFKDGLEFIISKVALNNEIKQEYLSTPIKATVLLEKTKCEPVMQTGGAKQPAPRFSCADCVQLNNKYAFDLTALVASVSEPRQINGLRYVRNLGLIDGTRVKDKVAIPTIALYYNRPSLTVEPPEMEALEQLRGSAQAVSVYGLLNAKKGDVFQLEGGSDWFWKEAKDTAKAKQLSDDATKIHGTSATDRESIGGSSFTPNEKRDWSQVKGHETICAHMAWLVEKTNVSDLDDVETVWQINWCEIAVSPLSDGGLKTKDGTRLWVRVTLRDCSSHVTLYMTQDSVLELSALNSAEEWLEKYAAGDFVFPIVGSVKIRRTMKSRENNSDASQLTGNASEGKALASLAIVHAMEQPWEQHRTQESMAMVQALRHTSFASSQMLPAHLSMIVSSGQYPIGVKYNDLVVPCQKVITFIASLSKSKAEDAGDDAFLLKTEGITDACEESATGGKYNIIAMCRRSNQAAFRLDPPRGNKPQYAIAILTAIVETGYVAEQIQLISENDALNVRNALLMEMTLAEALSRQVASAVESWTPTVTPLNVKTCRALGRSPTGAALPKYQKS